MNYPIKPGSASRLGLRKPSGLSPQMKELFERLRWIESLPDVPAEGMSLLAKAAWLGQDHDVVVEVLNGVRRFTEYAKALELASQPPSRWARFRAVFRR